MLSLLAGLIVGAVVGVVSCVRERDKNYLIYMPLGLAIGLALAIGMGVFVPGVPVDVVGEYPLKAFGGEVYVVERETKGTYTVNTGVEGFDSVFSVASTELVFDSRVKAGVVVYALGHVGYLKYFTFVPNNGLRYYRIVVPDKYSVKKIP